MPISGDTEMGLQAPRLCSGVGHSISYLPPPCTPLYKAFYIFKETLRACSDRLGVMDTGR